MTTLTPALAMDDAQRARILAPTGSFAAAERFEAHPGGTLTGSTRSVLAGPDPALDRDERMRFSLGRSLFERPWVSAPSSTRASDGLGPLYNERSCVACHGSTRATPVVHLGMKGNAGLPDPVYGRQLQTHAVPGVPPEGQVLLQFEEQPVELSAGAVVQLRRPVARLTDLGYGKLDQHAALSLRVPPPLWGAGLLEAVGVSDILALEDPQDEDGDGISGRSNWIPNVATGGRALGRFGWKASAATLAAQNARAMATDIGLSSFKQPAAWGDCTAIQEACRVAPRGAPDMVSPFEASDEIMDLIAAFARLVPVPAREDLGEPEVLQGKELFYGLGCVGCHAPKLATRLDAPERALRGQLIWPYSDLLLHDMGDGLADELVEGTASGAEWRTAPLWGVGLPRPQGYLHDGRARTLIEAILWHGGEAATSRASFDELPASDRAALLRFLESL